jgi:fructose-1,6-bisphosphatase/inositol monophosphatase family enzyme
MTHPLGVSPLSSRTGSYADFTLQVSILLMVIDCVPICDVYSPANGSCSGTVNFAHLSPFYWVSIGFVVKGKPVIGVINAPFLQQTFSACHGKGAWLNETQRLPLLRNPIPPLPKSAPKGCIFSCEWGKDRRDILDGNLQRKVESFVNMASELDGRDGKGGMVHGVRSLGSATLDLAYCAMGSFDICWEAVSCLCKNIRLRPID